MAQNSDPDARAIRPNHVVNTYAALQRQVRDAGLLNRRRGYYIALFTILAIAWAGGWTGFALIGPSWYQLLIAAGLGILMTQFGFLAHEAAHSQVFASWRPTNGPPASWATGSRESAMPCGSRSTRVTTPTRT
ncbi:hypothetical protein ACLMMA_15020 [Micrococcus luteus]